MTNCRTDIIINILFMFIFDCPFSICHNVSATLYPFMLFHYYYIFEFWISQLDRYSKCDFRMLFTTNICKNNNFLSFLLCACKGIDIILSTMNTITWHNNIERKIVARTSYSRNEYLIKLFLFHFQLYIYSITSD